MHITSYVTKKQL